jgi:four helix bundle protein
MIAKLAIVEEEVDEVLYWLELLADTYPEQRAPAGELFAEAEEILKMTVSSLRTLKGTKS